MFLKSQEIFLLSALPTQSSGFLKACRVPAIAQKMQLVPSWDESQMQREGNPSYLSFVIINVVLNKKDKRWKKRRQGAEDYRCTGGRRVVSEQMVRCGAAWPDASDSCTGYSLEVSLDSQNILSFQWKSWPCLFLFASVSAHMVRWCEAGGMTGGSGE